MKKTTMLNVLGGVVLVSACSWVKEKPGADMVSVANHAQVSNCEKLGESSAQTAYKVGIVKRGAEKVASELIALAKNEAATMGGDAIVPASDIVEGRQSFTVYRCR